MEGGTAIVTNNGNICYRNLINQLSAVGEQRPCNGAERDDRNLQMSSFLYFTICHNTKLMISVMNGDNHERSLKRYAIPQALLVKPFSLKP